MQIRHRVSMRRIRGGLVAGIALLALSGCYPYYYDAHYSSGGHGYERDHGGKRSYYGGGHYYYRDRHKHGRHKRYKHYRNRW